MDLPAIIAKIVGVALLGWTVLSIIKHVKQKRVAAIADKDQPAQSVSEQVLNGLLLYLWLAFMLAFSTGMIINN